MIRDAGSGTAARQRGDRISRSWAVSAPASGLDRMWRIWALDPLMTVAKFRARYSAYGPGTLWQTGVLTAKHRPILPVAVLMRHAMLFFVGTTAICHGPVNCACAFGTSLVTKLAAAAVRSHPE